LLLGFGVLGFGALGFGADGCGFEGWLVGAAGCVVLLVDGEDCCVELFVVVDVDVVFVAAFFLAGFLASALRPGSVPPTSTPATAAGAATLIVSAFVPGPAVAVLLPPPELAMPNAAAKAAITAMSPMAIVRGSICSFFFLAAFKDL
jgi:hypothetical protein